MDFESALNSAVRWIRTSHAWWEVTRVEVRERVRFLGEGDDGMGLRGDGLTGE